MEKNEVYTAICTGYTEDGLGVTRINGAVIFVPNLIVGEEAEISAAVLEHIGRPEPHHPQVACHLVSPFVNVFVCMENHGGIARGAR